MALCNLLSYKINKLTPVRLRKDKKMKRTLIQIAKQWRHHENKLLESYYNHGTRNEGIREIRWMRQHIQSRFAPRSTLSQCFDKLERYVQERTLRHKPIQYILQSVDFCGMQLATRKPVLIPRWETEEIVKELVEIIHLKQDILKSGGETLNIADLGCGSGCISVALAHLIKIKSNIRIIGVDLNLRAVLLSRVNERRRKNLYDKGPNVSFIVGDLFDDISIQSLGDVDIFVSNPPYIPKCEYEKLDPSVRDWEDQGALTTHDNGMACHKRILEIGAIPSSSLTTQVIKEGYLPRVVIEINGNEQRKPLEIYALLNLNYSRVDVHVDSAGHDRALFCYL